MLLAPDNLLVLTIVALAAAYLARRAWGTLAGKRKAGCGSCATCPAEGAKPGEQLISVDRLIASGGRTER